MNQSIEISKIGDNSALIIASTGTIHYQGTNKILNIDMDKDSYQLVKLQAEEFIKLKGLRINSFSHYKFGNQSYLKIGDYSTQEGKWLIGISIRLTILGEIISGNPCRGYEHYFVNDKEIIQFGNEIEDLINNLLMNGDKYDQLTIDSEGTGIDYNNTNFEKYQKPERKKQDLKKFESNNKFDLKKVKK